MSPSGPFPWGSQLSCFFLCSHGPGLLAEGFRLGCSHSHRVHVCEVQNEPEAAQIWESCIYTAEVPLRQLSTDAPDAASQIRSSLGSPRK